MILKGERPPVDMWHYIVGNIRYTLYYSKFKFLIRKHILEQIEQRLIWMDKDCYNEGSCKICGCQTIQLQMCNKSCDKPCYPAIMNRKTWDKFNVGRLFFRDKNGLWYKDNEGRIKLLNETIYGFQDR